LGIGANTLLVGLVVLGVVDLFVAPGLVTTTGALFAGWFLLQEVMSSTGSDEVGSDEVDSDEVDSDEVDSDDFFLDDISISAPFIFYFASLRILARVYV
jgi:hypothetical protein